MSSIKKMRFTKIKVCDMVNTRDRKGGRTFRDRLAGVMTGQGVENLISPSMHSSVRRRLLPLASGGFIFQSFPGGADAPGGIQRVLLRKTLLTLRPPRRANAPAAARPILFRRAARRLRKGVNKARFGLISFAERHPYLVTDPELQFIRRAISKKAVRMFSFVLYYNIQIFHASSARFLCVCLFIGEADFLLQ